MSKNNSKLDTQIDAGKFFATLFKIFFCIGVVWFLIWFYANVYKPEERAYISAARYAFSAFQKEATAFYKEKGYVFNQNNVGDDEFCKIMTSKYAKNKSGNCTNTNPLTPVQNFTFKGKDIAVYGLEKPPFIEGDSFAKDIIIDTNTENKGDNQVGSDRVLLRIYSTGRSPATVTPVNCSKMDEQEYGFKTSIYCIGSPEFNYLIVNKPLGFDIEQIGAEDGKTKIIGKNLSFARADCSAFDGLITNENEFCSDKMYYLLRGCDDEYSCNIALTKY